MARNPLTTLQSGGLLGGGDPFLSLQREMNRLFNDAFRGTGILASPDPSQGASIGQFINASMNVSETENEIRVTAELPGVTEQDVEVTLDDDVLTIRGKKQFEKADEKENFHFIERSYGTFQRSLRLPFQVDPVQVKASFENGVLTVTLPKTPQQERSRRIQVQAARGGKESSDVSGAGNTRGETRQ
jgi:HSP20 family protein